MPIVPILVPSSLIWALASPAFAALPEETWQLVGISGIGVILGGVFFFSGFKALKKKRLIEDTPTSTIRAMAPGQVEVSGKAVGWKAVIAPFSQKPCVYYRYSVEEQRERQVKDKDGRTRTEHYWVTLLSGETDGSPFYLEDGTGKVLVDPQGAEVIVPADHEFSSHGSSGVPGHVLEFLGKKGVELSWGKPTRFEEASLRVGETIYALGVCQKAQPRKDAPEGAVEEYRLGQGKEEEVFMISDKGQKSLAGSLGWKVFGGIFFGVLILAGVGYFLVKVLSVNF